MLVRVWVRASALFLASVLAGSCASLGPVRGIPPAIEAADVERASDNVGRILAALAEDTRIKSERPDVWYLVAEAGFNYVDDRCSEYFYSLFRLNRRRESIKSGLTSFGQTTNAILQATGATSISMTVVAQAFGLASTMTDVVAGTYLYQLPPATTQAFVAKLRKAFRDGTLLEKEKIQTPTAAYHAIQDYLSLCLPPTIEARIVEHVAAARAVGDPTGAGVTVLVGSEMPVPLRPITVRERLTPAPALKPRACLPTPYEATLRSRDIGEIQKALCLTADGKMGSETRVAVYQFFQGYGKERADILSCGILYPDSGPLHEAIDAANGRTCQDRGFSSAKEVGLSLH